MATENNPFVPAPTVDNLQQINQTALAEVFDLYKFANQNLIRSAKFAARFLTIPRFLEVNTEIRRQLMFLCDAIEFPGQTLTALDYRIPGKLKVKIPYLRELNEVNFSFYVSSKVPVYALFNAWIAEISPNTAQNRFFDELVGEIDLIQLEDTTNALAFSVPEANRHMRVKLIDVYPLNVQSMQSTWGDDGYHKVNVSFYFRDLVVTKT